MESCIYVHPHISVTEKKRSIGSGEIVLLLITILSFCFFGINSILNYLIAGFYAISLLVFSLKQRIGLLFAPTAMFASVLVLDAGSSFFRIYEVVFIVSFFANLLAKRDSIRFSISSIFIPVVWSFFSILYSGLSGIISCVLTVLMIVDIKKQISQDEGFKTLLLLSIVLSGLASGIYGFFVGNTILSGSGVRYSGAIGDPNYSCLYYLISLFSLLCCSFFGKKTKVILGGVFFVLILLTQSISGILGLFVFLALYSTFRNSRKSVITVLSILLIILLLWLIPIPSSSVIGAFKDRIIYKINTISAGDYNALTTGRTDLWNNYLDYFRNNVPLLNKLFGGINSVSGESRNLFLSMFGQVSHNSFIDMLFLIGIIGELFVIIVFLRSIIFLIIKYKKDRDLMCLWELFLKLIVVYYSFSISIFTMKFYAFAFLI